MTDSSILVVVFAGSFVLAALACTMFWIPRWRAGMRSEAKDWPTADARIQNSEMVANGRYDQLPSFEFVFTVEGEYYVGHFELSAQGERADTLLREMIDRHVSVQYDPKKPSRSYVPEEMIEGCQVKQGLL